TGGAAQYGQWWGYPILTYGQLLDIETPNQHGVVGPYLWSTGGGRYDMYDAFTGDYILSLEGVPRGTTVFGKDGSILIYRLDTKGDRLTVWNSTAAVGMGGPAGSDIWQWRPWTGATIDVSGPYNWTTADGRYTWEVNPYTLDVSIPSEISGSIIAIFAGDLILGSTSLTPPGERFMTPPYSRWALSLEPGREGELLWLENYTPPPGNLSIWSGPVSVEDRVFTMMSKETRQWWGYSLDDGSLLWGPTEPETQLHLYSRGNWVLLNCYR
ncbi:unnamed protein product, partial [marine sediment metagenome]